jgi:hypothetical protein
MGDGGMVNPDAHIKCGTMDATALLPEPIHFGGCKECAREIRLILQARNPQPQPTKVTPEEQKGFDW